MEEQGGIADELKGQLYSFKTSKEGMMHFSPGCLHYTICSLTRAICHYIVRKQTDPFCERNASFIHHCCITQIILEEHQ